ncbi:hypothetical protein A5849_000948 [Enterococcus sp. 10F3_DIV0382]|nr:hypothetical protein A5849_000948 [Enterococcus sp. 10F3_DIV0382]
MKIPFAKSVSLLVQTIIILRIVVTLLENIQNILLNYETFSYNILFWNLGFLGHIILENTFSVNLLLLVLVELVIFIACIHSFALLSSIQDKNEYQDVYKRQELFQWFQEEFPDVPKENLKKDLVVFLQALNNRGIINYTLPKRTSIKEKISCSIKKIQKNLRTSHSIYNEKTLKIFLEVCFHVLKENFPIITFVCGVNLLCLLFLFLSFQEIRLEFLWILFPAFSYLVLLMSIILHETTHLILYRKITHHNHGYLSIKTLSMSIVREKVLDRKSNILITFSGAIFVFFLGVLLYFLSDNLWIRIPAFIFMFHIINLLPFFGDGHTIITELLNSND